MKWIPDFRERVDKAKVIFTARKAKKEDDEPALANVADVLQSSCYGNLARNITLTPCPPCPWSSE